MDHFDVQDRQLEKQRLREQDDEALRSGAKSAAELAIGNGLFSGLAIARARIGRRGTLRA